MPENIEIKAKANDWDNQITLTTRLCADRRIYDSQAGGRVKIAGKLANKKEKLIQEDTFFNCPDGRLKLREQRGKEDYLIFYKRSDNTGPKHSEYFTYPTNNSKGLKNLLSKALGKTKVIKKKRMLFLVGQTRIHFDEVLKLGKFIEIEVCLKKNQTRLNGFDIANRIMKALNINKKDLIKNAYADLL